MANISITIQELYDMIKNLENKISESTQSDWEIIFNGYSGNETIVGIPSRFKKIIIYGANDSNVASNLNKMYEGAVPTSSVQTNPNNESRLTPLKVIDDIHFYTFTNLHDSTDNGMMIIGTTKNLYYKFLDLFSSLFSKGEVVRIG